MLRQMFVHKLLHLRLRQRAHLQLFLNSERSAQRQIPRRENHRRIGIVVAKLLQILSPLWRWHLIHAIQQQQQLAIQQQIIHLFRANPELCLAKFGTNCLYDRAIAPQLH